MTSDRITLCLLCLASALVLFPTSAQARWLGVAAKRKWNGAAIWLSGASVVMGAGWAIAGLGGIFLGLIAVLVGGWYRFRGEPKQDTDPLVIAASWDAMAACLRSGLDLCAATMAVAPQLPAQLAQTMTRTARLLALGASAQQAWRPALMQPDVAELARAAMRTESSGAELAVLIVELADRLRDKANDVASARAARTNVVVTGPLGLCFLPAFLCLGIVPVVFGLAGGVLAG